MGEQAVHPVLGGSQLRVIDVIGKNSDRIGEGSETRRLVPSTVAGPCAKLNVPR